MKMGSYISRREDWVDYVIRKPSDVKKQETKQIKQKTKPQSESDSEFSDSSSSSDYKYNAHSSKLP